MKGYSIEQKVNNMAVTNFIPQIWEARLMAKFHERSVEN